MKKWFVLLIFFALGIAACCQRTAHEDNTVNTSGVFTPTATNCLATGTCGTINNGIFQTYPVSNGCYTGCNTNFRQGFNACPYGSVPVFHPRIGLACLPLHYLHGMRHRFAYWSWNAMAFSFSFSGWYSGASHFDGGVISMCSQSNGCGQGSCVPVGESEYGVCGESHDY